MIYRSIAFAILLALLAPLPAAAQVLCGRHDELVKKLQERHGESRVATALTDSGWLLEIFVSEGVENTWSMLVTNPLGLACMHGAGTSWRFDKPSASDTEADGR